jgi:O-antigen/teichoic acid export membrane protein
VTFATLVRSSALYAVGNFLPRIGAFLLLPFYVRFLTRGEYGTVALITSMASFLAIVYRLGMDGALMRLHFDESGARQRALYSTLAGLALASSLAGALISALLVAPIFGTLFSGLDFVPFGVLAIAIAAASAASFSPGVFYRATAQPWRFLLYALGIFFASSAASVTFVLLGWGAVGILFGQLVGALAGLAITVVLGLRIAGISYERSVVAPALRFGLPLVPHLVSAWALRLADRMLIGLLIGLPASQALDELGVYSLGYQLGFVITVIVSSFNAAWSPWFFRVADRPESPILFRGMTTIVMAALLAIGVGASALAPQIVAVIANPEYAAAADVLPVVAMASVLFALYTMLTTIVFYAKATGRLALITVAAAVLNVSVNIILIPPFGILGAAWATFASYAFFAAATWRYASTLYPVHLDVKRLAFLAGAAIIALLAASASELAPSSALQVTIRVAATLGFASLAAVVSVQPAREIRRARA